MVGCPLPLFLDRWVGGLVEFCVPISSTPLETGGGEGGGIAICVPLRRLIRRRHSIAHHTVVVDSDSEQEERFVREVQFSFFASIWPGN